MYRFTQSFLKRFARVSKQKLKFEGIRYVPPCVLAFGLVIGKCDEKSTSNCSSSCQSASCTPSCSNSVQTSKISSCDKQMPAAKCCQTFQKAKIEDLRSIESVSANMNKNNQPEELTHQFLIKQASSVIVDSVTRLLMETTSALQDYHQQYREMMSSLLNLLEGSRIASADELTSELINCKMIMLRNQMEEVKKALQETELFLGSVEALANHAAQTVFLARAEYPSVALLERLQSAQTEICRIKEETKVMENELVQLQAVVIVESGKSLKG